MDDNIGKQYVDWDLNFKVNVIPATSTSLEQIEIVAEVDINTEEPDKLTLFALKWN